MLPVWLILYLVCIWLGLIVDDYILTKRHVKMFKKVMDEELRKLKAEALSTPGGEIYTGPHGKILTVKKSLSGGK
jgi:hypothetical protein